MSTECKLHIIKDNEQEVTLFMSHDGFPRNIGGLIKPLLQESKSPEQFLWNLLSCGFEPEYCYEYGETDFEYYIFPELKQVSFKKYKTPDVVQLDLENLDKY
jgi:hypothetical protein